MADWQQQLAFCNSRATNTRQKKSLENKTEDNSDDVDTLIYHTPKQTKKQQKRQQHTNHQKESKYFRLQQQQQQQHCTKHDVNNSTRVLIIKGARLFILVCRHWTSHLHTGNDCWASTNKQHL